MEGVWLTTVAWRTEPSTRDFSSAEMFCWTAGGWPWVSRVCTVKLDTWLVLADLRPGPLTSHFEASTAKVYTALCFWQSSRRLSEGRKHPC